jgi:DNA-binding CsgD family transcriptional regulator/predicted regulator of Ras-like GTPase activity (Roadblock/LC7/MglB family)
MADDKTKRRPGPARDATAPRVEVALLELAGPSPGTMHRLRDDATVIGRGDDADITLVDEGVSRKHAKLLRSAGGLLNVVDLGSTNGVFVNGEQVEISVVQLGDMLELGPDVRLRVVDARMPVGEDTRPVKSAVFELTDRQLDIARLVAMGLTNTAIGEALQISPRTVTSHLDHIYTRLGISSRAALATQLAEAGLLRDSGDS